MCISKHLNYIWKLVSCFEKSYGEGNVQGNISNHLNYIWKLVSCFEKSYGEGNVLGNTSK